ncbi:MAG: C25 family peptidase C-terminal domain-containing protein, partial [Saprospiraceae bacterium]
LGEAVQRAGNATTGEAWGTIAGFFSSDFQSWAPPMEGQDGMNQYLIDADGVTLTPAIGPMLAMGNAKMIAAYAAGGELMADFWNAFADPTTMPRTQLPQILIATHAPATFIGTGSLTVNSPVEGAFVSLYWQGQTLAVATVSGGIASLNFPPLNNVGSITVTVTQFNYLPYQGEVTVTPASGPFVVNQSVILNDALLGNNNNQADFGETVALNVTLANVGLELASATSATLSTLDANVTITDGSEIFGDLLQDEVISKDAAFTFQVDNDIADGHVVNFDLHIEYGNAQSFDAVIPVKLQAPILIINPFQVTDAVGGNGNNRLESGETAVIHITNLNVGHSQSPSAIGTLSTGSPYLTVSGPLLLGKIDAITGTADASFSVVVAADAPQAVPADFHYALKAGIFETTQDFNLTINAILETFESHNYASYPWVQSGNKPWIISSPTAYTGTYSSRSGGILNNQKSIMQLSLNIIADGTIGFARKVSCETDYDFLYFRIDGVEVEKWSGELPWAEVTYPVTAGIHAFSWSYEKDAIGAQGSDHAWVDDVVLPPYQVVVATGSPEVPGLDLQIAPNPTNGRSWLRLQLPTEQSITVELFDCLGRRLRVLQAPTRQVAGELNFP